MTDDIATIMRRFYHDGPDIPETPELQTAEGEYRKAFLAAAREAANWHEPDEAALKKAWNARRQARRRAEENIDGAFVLYRPGHSAVLLWPESPELLSVLQQCPSNSPFKGCVIPSDGT